MRRYVAFSRRWIDESYRLRQARHSQAKRACEVQELWLSYCLQGEKSDYAYFVIDSAFMLIFIASQYEAR